MKIYPKCSMNSLASAEPGKIARYMHNNHFGLICQVNQDERALLFFGDDGPYFYYVSRPDDIQLMIFEGETVWEIDPCLIDASHRQQQFNQNGAVGFMQEGWMMNIKPESGSPIRGQRTLDVENSAIISKRELLNEVVVFGKWAVYLHDSDRPQSTRIKVASFEAFKSDREN